MTYPKNYALLNEEEMEYTTGGVNSIVTTLCSLGVGLLSYMNIANIGAIAGQVQKEYPDLYPEEEGTLNGNLIIDSTVAYFTSPMGALLGLANLGVAAGYVYCLLN